MEKSVLELVDQWLEWDQDSVTRNEIIALRDAGNVADLEKRLRSRIQFGTAGLRGTMQAGFSFMNSLTVIQASQGLAVFVKHSHQNHLEKGRGPINVIIGYDARHNSAKFARLASNAFTALGMKVFLSPTHCPTPYVPFSIVPRKAMAGVMVTASHNPAKDNGYKVYRENGAQINSPLDSQIAHLIEQNLAPWEHAWDNMNDDFETIHSANSLLEANSREDVAESHYSRIKATCESLKLDVTNSRKFIYTPLHGVGGAAMERLISSMNIPQERCVFVPEQEKPDPDFPTLSFPNPEEVGALNLAYELADKEQGALIVANDPDADRFSAAEKVRGKWHQFTGDQIGALFAAFIIERLKATSADLSRTAMLTTAVSSSMFGKIVEANGLHFEETLTGFKYLGNLAHELRSDGYSVPLAYEEALGYMFSDVCYDKDGLTAAMLFLAMDTAWSGSNQDKNDGTEKSCAENHNPRPLHAKLQSLYETYGYHESLNTYFVSPNRATTDQLFASIRSSPEGDTRAKGASIGAVPVLRIRDVTLGLDSGTENGLSRLTGADAGQMITVWSEIQSDDGVVSQVRATLRGSGTEPKIKIYIEASAETQAAAINGACGIFREVLSTWISPFAPEATYASTQLTSSGYSFVVG